MYMYLGFMFLAEQNYSLTFTIFYASDLTWRQTKCSPNVVELVGLAKRQGIQILCSDAYWIRRSRFAATTEGVID